MGVQIDKGELNMKLEPRIVSLSALAMLCGATAANAADVAPTYPFPGGFTLATSGGVVNPEILVGFNPQPDPPGAPDPSLDLSDPYRAVVTEASGTTFNFVLSFLGLPGGLLPAVDEPTWNSDLNQWTINFDLDGGGNAFHVDLYFSGPGSSITWDAFNPQPDPPGAFTAYTIGFTGDASVGVQIQENDAILTFTAVPEPSTWAMMGLGFAALGAFSLRAHRSARPV